MRVRALKPGDLAILTTMVVEFERFLGAINGSRTRVDAAKIKTSLKSGGFGTRKFFAGIIAEKDGEALGYLLYHLGFSTNFGCGTLFVSDLFVRKQARRKGVGEALMKRAMDIAKVKGCGRVEWTVWNINAAAIGFYMKLGAKPLDDELILGIQLGGRKKS